MILTLGLFLTHKEQKTSRLLCSPTAVDEPNAVIISSSSYQYEPGLYLQGYTSVSRITKKEGYLQLYDDSSKTLDSSLVKVYLREVY